MRQTLLNKLARKISQLPLEKLISFRKRLGLYMFPLLIPLYLFFAYAQSLKPDSSSFGPLLSMFSIILFIIWFLVFILIQQAFVQGINEALVYHLDTVKVRQFYTIKSQSLKKSQPKDRIVLKRIFAQLDFLEGQFESALSTLLELKEELEANPIKFREELLLDCYYNMFLVSIFGRQKVDIEAIKYAINSLSFLLTDSTAKKEAVLGKMSALYKIVVTKEGVEKFEVEQNLPPLQALFQQFYQALNFDVKGDLSGARRLYSDLAKKNARLFIVKESIMRLETLNDN